MLSQVPLFCIVAGGVQNCDELLELEWPMELTMLNRESTPQTLGSS